MGQVICKNLRSALKWNTNHTGAYLLAMIATYSSDKT